MQRSPLEPRRLSPRTSIRAPSHSLAVGETAGGAVGSGDTVGASVALVRASSGGGMSGAETRRPAMGGSVDGGSPHR